MKSLKNLLTALAFVFAIGAVFAFNSVTPVAYANPSSSGGTSGCYSIISPSLVPQGCLPQVAANHCKVIAGSDFLFEKTGCITALMKP